MKVFGVFIESLKPSKKFFIKLPTKLSGNLNLYFKFKKLMEYKPFIKDIETFKNFYSTLMSESEKHSIALNKILILQKE